MERSWMRCPSAGTSPPRVPPSLWVPQHSLIVVVATSDHVDGLIHGTVLDERHMTELLRGVRKSCLSYDYQPLR